MSKEIIDYKQLADKWFESVEDARQKNKEKLDEITDKVNEKLKETGSYAEAFKLYCQLMGVEEPTIDWLNTASRYDRNYVILKEEQNVRESH